MKDTDITVTRHGLRSRASWGWLRAAAFLVPALILLLRTAVAVASPPVDLSRPLSLEQAIQLALARNPDVGSAQRALEAAEAARRAAVGKLFPQLRALSWYEVFPTQPALLLPRYMAVPSLSQVAAPTPQQSMRQMLDYQRSEFQDSVFNVGIGLSWPLYAGGRLRAGVRGARATAEASGYHLKRVRQQLIFAVTQTYLGIGVTERTERAVEGSIKQLTEVRTNLEEFVRVGEKPRLDLLRVNARLEQTREVLAAVQAQLVTVQGNLRQLLDLDPAGPPLPLAGGQPDDGVEIPPLAEAVHLALTHRPDYRALMSDVKAQRAKLRIAHGARLPEVDLSARAWEAHGNRTGAPGDAFRTWEPDSEVMLSISVPLFTGGTLLAQEDRERARLEEKTDQFEALSQRVRLDVTQAYAELHAAHAQLVAARADVASADEAFRLEREKTDVGTGIVTDLLQAQATDLQAQRDFYQAHAGVRIARTRVQLALGVLTGS